MSEVFAQLRGMLTTWEEDVALAREVLRGIELDAAYSAYVKDVLDRSGVIFSINSRAVMPYEEWREATLEVADAITRYSAKIIVDMAESRIKKLGFASKEEIVAYARSAKLGS